MRRSNARHGLLRAHLRSFRPRGERGRRPALRLGEGDGRGLRADALDHALRPGRHGAAAGVEHPRRPRPHAGRSSPARPSKRRSGQASSSRCPRASTTARSSSTSARTAGRSSRRSASRIRSGRWRFDLYAGAWFFTPNDDFFGGQSPNAGPARRPAGPRHLLRSRRELWAGPRRDVVLRRADDRRWRAQGRPARATRASAPRSRSRSAAGTR